jgi:hypothetical protein
VGQAAYRALATCFVLTEPVRQSAAGTLIGPLTRVRNGVLTLEDVRFWNNRQISFQPEPATWSLTNPRTLVACCFAKDRARLNEVCHLVLVRSRPSLNVGAKLGL